MDQKKINSFLIYKLGTELFATNVGNIVKILEISEITKIPGAPEYVKGIINLRGSVLPVIDGRIKLGFPDTVYTRNSCIVVFEILIAGSVEIIGVIVDAVLKVTTFNTENILPPPNVGMKFSKDYLLGVHRNNNGFVLIIDINKVFTGEDLVGLSHLKGQ